jgi:hypothetical protein
MYYFMKDQFMIVVLYAKEIVSYAYNHLKSC